MPWIESLALGAVQGLTEFLPVSSDGHLVVTHQVAAWLTGKKTTGAEDLFFDLMLHLGTLLAVAVYYRAVAATGAKGLLGSPDVPPLYRRPALVRTGTLVIVATTPLIPLKIFFMKWIESTFESLTVTGIGFLITASVLLLTFWLQRGEEAGKGPAETTWLDALLIGIAQMFAPLPGVSRSGMTVATALSLGFSRTWAVGFSFLIAFPAILGGAVIKLHEVDRSTLTADRVSQIVAAAALAGLVGYGAIIWLVKIVRSGKLWYFSVYLLVLGLAVLAAAAFLGSSPSPGASSDARREENAAVGTVRGGRSGSASERGSARPEGLVASSVAAGALAGSRRVGAVVDGRPGALGLVLG